MLLKFRTDKGRDPTSDSYSEDAELLLQIRNDVLESLGISPDLLPDDFVRLASAQTGMCVGCWSLLRPESQGDSCTPFASCLSHLLPVL